jgi:hypothetical protein
MLDGIADNAASTHGSAFHLYRICGAGLLLWFCSSAQSAGMVTTGDFHPDAIYDDTVGVFCALEASWSR